MSGLTGEIIFIPSGGGIFPPNDPCPLLIYEQNLLYNRRRSGGMENESTALERFHTNLSTMIKLSDMYEKVQK